MLLANKAWVQDTFARNEFYFRDLATDQKPAFLWIGCSDSRVTAERITGAEPGKMFVHRNIANMVVPGDLNMLSVVQYAVEVLKVQHVIICGHYECGGVRTALSDLKLGLIDQWIQYVKNGKDANQAELDAIPDAQDRFNRLVELNVKAQVHNMSRTASVQKMWQLGEQPILHGRVFDLHTGLTNEMIDLLPGDQVVPAQPALTNRHD